MNMFYRLQDTTFGLIIVIFFLNAGKTTLGHGNTDINIQGPGVAAMHCYIENQAGTVTLVPCGNQCSMDGLAVTKPVRLSQGTHVEWFEGKIKTNVFLMYPIHTAFSLTWPNLIIPLHPELLSFKQ